MMKSVAESQLVATVAKLLQQADVSKEALPAAAQVVAEEIAAHHPGSSAVSLLAAVPAAWFDDPTSSSSQNMATAYLQVAEPVLGIDLASIAPAATRGIAALQSSVVTIAINRARLVEQSPSAALCAPVDVTAGVGAALQALNAVFADRQFPELVGGGRYRRLCNADLGREALGCFQDLHHPPTSSVFAAGVEVAGPNVAKAVQARPFGLFAQLPQPVAAAELARLLVALSALRESLGEESLRGAIQGGEAQVVCGRAAAPAALPLHLTLSPDGKSIELGLALDLAKLRAYEPTTLDDLALTKSVGSLLRSRWNTLAAALDKGVPAGIALDPGCAGAVASFASKP